MGKKHKKCLSATKKSIISKSEVYMLWKPESLPCLKTQTMCHNSYRQRNQVNMYNNWRKMVESVYLILVSKTTHVCRLIEDGTHVSNRQCLVVQNATSWKVLHKPIITKNNHIQLDNIAGWPGLIFQIMSLGRCHIYHIQLDNIAGWTGLIGQIMSLGRCHTYPKYQN